MRVTVGTAYYGPYDKQFYNCIAALNQKYPEVQTTGVNDCAYIDQAKSIIATKHMEDSDVVVIVDHDMIFEPEMLMLLAESAMEADAVVGAAYCLRSQQGRQIAGFAMPPLTFFEGGGRIEATALAGGFLAIPTRVLRELVHMLLMEKAETTFGFMAYPFFWCICEDGKWWGEDLSFCWRLNRIDQRFYIDTRIRVGHKGTYVYQIEDALQSVPRLKSIEISKPEE